jgi:hypothetical protein
MKLKITLILLALSLSVCGKQVSADKAKEVAMNFLSQGTINQFKGSLQLNLVKITISSSL